MTARALGTALACMLACALARAADTVVVVRGDGVRVEFAVEVAASEATRKRGLMGRDALAPRTGMWFDFGSPTLVSMWMKDTSLPLDMLYVDSGGRIVAIRAHATPYSTALLGVPLPIRYVLEINGGESDVLGIAVGDRAWLTRQAAP